MIKLGKKLKRDPLAFANEKIKYYDNAWIRYRVAYIILSVFVSLLAIASALMTAFIIYNTNRAFDPVTKKVVPKPSWYFYAQTALAAVISMVGSFLNFFFIKKRYTDAGKLRHQIHTESILFRSKIGIYKESNINKEYDFYLEISKICGIDIEHQYKKIQKDGK